MSMRIEKAVRRPAPVTVYVNGLPVEAYEGESIATALLAAGHDAPGLDRYGRPRGPYCNMGICCDCMVTVEDPAGPLKTGLRLRSCLATVSDGLRIFTSDGHPEEAVAD